MNSNYSENLKGFLAAGGKRPWRGGEGARGLLKFRIYRHIISLFISYFELLIELLKKRLLFLLCSRDLDSREVFQKGVVRSYVSVCGIYN